MKRKILNFQAIIMLAQLSSPLLLVNCGRDQPHKGQGHERPSKVEQAFLTSARKYHIPSRLLLAIAHVESNLHPEKSFTLNVTGAPEVVRVGETIFGISRQELSIPDGEEGDKPEVQIEAYSKWLNGKIGQISLPQEPKSSEEKFQWLWEVSQYHRQSKLGRKNARILFVREVINTLNQGFTWQDFGNKESIHFEKEATPLRLEDLKPVSQALLKTSTRKAQIPSATFIPLLEGDGPYLNSEDSIPEGIEIIHCPFNLSACIELQRRSVEEKNGDGMFEAHYVIPQDDSLSELPLQIASHESPLAPAAGKQLEAKHRVTIMLAGYSGKIVNGIRRYVHPRWMSKWQLQRMGELVVDVCHRLIADHGGSFPFNLTDCMTVGKGVHFKVQDKKGSLAWGDIADFDEQIFTSYLKAPDGLAGETAFEFSTKERMYDAGTPVRFTLAFQPRVQVVEIERLVRCPKGEAVWTNVATADVRSQVQLQFEPVFWDAGPNMNGEQYLRAKVYDEGGTTLLGWDIGQVFLQKYESKTSARAFSVCQ